VIVDPGELTRAEATALVNGLVAPRPIAWVSTVALDGRRNLAPFSYFNAFSTSPPTVAIGPGSRSGVYKDSLRNVKDTGELTISVVTEELAATANLTSAELRRDVDEWELAGLEPAPSEDVGPPRVAVSPAALECRVVQVVDLGSPDEPTNSVVVARVTRIHVDEAVLAGFVPDPELMQLVGRMGGSLWCTTRDRFTLVRPTVEEALARGQE
jgi:flavin reductase (DIM6/NTAB) family NADH-FMN oxidoreductase RutF